MRINKKNICIISYFNRKCLQHSRKLFYLKPMHSMPSLTSIRQTVFDNEIFIVQLRFPPYTLIVPVDYIDTTCFLMMDIKE